MKPQKVAVLSESYWPDVCGVANVARSLCECLSADGHQVIVATEARGRQHLVLNGVSIREFNVFGNYVEGYKGEIEKYKNFLRQLECDVLITECAQTWVTDLCIDVINDIPAKVKILHSHDFSWFKRKARNPIKNLKWWYYYKKLKSKIFEFDCVFVLHADLPDAWWLHKVGYRNVVVLPNAVDEIFFKCYSTSEILNVKAKYCLESSMGYCISIGNYNELKNQKLVLRSFINSRLSEKFDLVFIGSQANDYATKLRHKALTQQKRAKVHVLYGIPRNEQAILLQGANLFIYGSKCEAFPLVICESIVSGVPWVSTNVGCLSSMPGGIIVNSGKQMIDALNEILENPDMHSRLRRDCFTSQKNFRLRDVMQTLYSTIYRLL